MGVTTDIVLTEFRLVGADNVLKTIKAMSRAYALLARNQARVSQQPFPQVPNNININTGNGSGGGGGASSATSMVNLLTRLVTTNRLAQVGLQNLATQVAGGKDELSSFATSAVEAIGPVALLAAGTLAAGAAIYGVGKACVNATNSLGEYAEAIANIRDISGESAEQSARAIAKFRMAGLSDQTEIREMLKLAKDLRTQGGVQALGLVQGLDIRANDSPLQVFDKLAVALRNMPGGLQKAAAESMGVGARLQKSLLDYARLDPKMADAAAKNAYILTDSQISASIDLQNDYRLLGETLLNKVVFPLGTALLPTMRSITDTLIRMVSGMQGFIGWVGGIIESFNKHILGIKKAADQSSNSLGSKLDNLANSVDNNTDSQQAMTQQLAHGASRGGIPTQLQNWDFNTLSRLGYLGGIG